MTLINLEFSPKMERAIIEGEKCCTTRDEPKGNVGDLFVLKDRLYRLIRVMPTDINEVNNFYDLEGFGSGSEFENELELIYPELTIGSVVWIHVFCFVGNCCKNFGKDDELGCDKNSGFCGGYIYPLCCQESEQ